jgi:hypothetical protein
MKVKMKAIDIVTILSEVSRAKKAQVYAEYGFDASIKNTLRKACQRGNWKLV